MNKVDFYYNDHNYFVQCNNDDKMKEIIIKFLEKSKIRRKDLYFLYNGQIINEDLTFNQCSNRLDKSRNYMNVLVIEGQSANGESNYLQKVNYIICPECHESAILSINNFKFSIEGCNGNHKKENLELDELKNMQYIDQSKIYCDNCHISKGEINDFKFFACNKCKKNLCPNCNETHDISHKDCIKDYEENQFLCKDHYIEYSSYCQDCKKDICSLCIISHENHNLTAYQTIMKELDIIKDKELDNTKEKIYQIKSIVNEMIYQLNTFNKNLNTYFEIYDNIISSFYNNKKNYKILRNIKYMKLYNNNFLGNLTEIIKDNNLKTQFINIINIKTKIGFKRIKQNEQNNKSTENITKNENIKDTKDSTLTDDNNNKILNNLDDKYENFSINKMEDLNRFVAKYVIENLLVLKDGRILTIQKYYDENGKDLYKLIVYSLKNTFICDINIDFINVKGLHLMDDGNVIIDADSYKMGLFINPKAIADSYQIIKILKIKQNDIEEIFYFGNKGKSLEKISNDKFLIEIKEKLDKPRFNNFFQINVYYASKKMIYKYDNNQLIFYKDIEEFYNSQKDIYKCVQINESEYAFYKMETDEVNGDGDFILFYDIETNKIIEKLKVGNGKNRYDMILVNKDNLIISGDGTIILIDTKNRKIINEFKFDDYIYFDYLLVLNESILLFFNYIEERKATIFYQFEFENLKNIKMKEKREIEDLNLNYGHFAKYKGNKIIIYCVNLISIYG